MARILIVDDDTHFRETLAETIVGFGHEVVQSDRGQAGLRELAHGRFDAVFLDQRMPEQSGLETLATLKAEIPDPPPVVMLTAFGSGTNTIEAMRLGAFDHISKPVGRDAIETLLQRLLHREPAIRPSAQGEQGELIGFSAPMREVHKRIGLAAASDAPVLILGETGSGKEMVARALHRHSTRSAAPFVAINCAAIPRELLESELFGHVRGAFTGAATDRPGCFRAASGGMLLLDEIGDMALPVQAKILRVLQEREVTPLGSNRAIRVDVRLVAATHRDLAAAVATGDFRADLMYRLNVLPISLPPLRERLADIIPLAEHFLRLAAPERPKGLSKDAAQALLSHPWPGNVRELKNLMERCQALLRTSVIGGNDLEALWQRPHQASAAEALPREWLDAELPTAVARLERILIEHALAQSNDNRAEAARRLGIHRQLFYRKLKALGLD